MEAHIMEWIAGNWIWLVVVGGAFAIVARMAGNHGHNSHQGDRGHQDDHGISDGRVSGAPLTGGTPGERSRKKNHGCCS
jgi:hypothetical protein